MPAGDKMLDAKYRILELLKSEGSDFLSGEFICQQLQVSRTAIWKNIKALRRDGYQIEARPRAGYRLVSAPDSLLPTEWQPGLASQLIGRQARYFKATGSTNDVAKELARQGAAEGTVVVAEEQTTGRGRLGRVWQSPAQAGLYFSVILYPMVSPMEVTQVTLLAAVAVVRALARELGVTARVKWPNDVYLNGCKICGILAEMAAEADRVKYLVVGIGVNVNQGQEDFAALGSTASSLKLQVGYRVNRAAILRAILEELDQLYALWQTEGFASLRSLWKDVALWLGYSVLVSGGQRNWQGTMEDIDESGALVLRMPDGTIKKFYSGEVSLRLKTQQV